MNDTRGTRYQKAISGALAVAMHVAFFALIVLGVSWQQKQENESGVVVELWGSVPPAAKPEPKRLPQPPKREPQPEPPKPQPEPAAKPDVELQARLEKDRLEKAAAEAKRLEEEQQKAEAKRLEEERQKAEARRLEEERQKAEAKRVEEQRKQAEAKKREEERKQAEARKREEERKQAEARKREEERKRAEAKKREEERKLAAIRAQQEKEAAARREQEETLKRLAEQQATAQQRLIDEYKRRIRDKIRRFIVEPPNLQGNPEVEFNVVVLPGGEVLAVNKKRGSAVSAYDEAVERAILKAQPLPLPPDPALHKDFRELTLKFRPKE